MTKYLYVIVQTADVKYSHETMLCDALGCHTPAQIPSSLPCHKSTPYKVRVFFVSLSMQSGREVAHPVPTMAVSQPSVGMSPPVPAMTLSQPSLAATGHVHVTLHHCCRHAIVSLSVVIHPLRAEAAFLAINQPPTR